ITNNAGLKRASRASATASIAAGRDQGLLHWALRCEVGPCLDCNGADGFQFGAISAFDYVDPIEGPISDLVSVEFEVAAYRCEIRCLQGAAERFFVADVAFYFG